MRPTLLAARLRSPAATMLLDTSLVAAPLGGATAAAHLAVTTLTHNPVSMGIIYALCDLFIPVNVGLAPMCGVLFQFPTALAIVLSGGLWTLHSAQQC